MTVQGILDGNFVERGHRASSILDTSMDEATHTVHDAIYSVPV